MTVRVSSKGQIVIPKGVREQLDLRAGTELSLDVQGQNLIMRRIVSRHGDWRTMEGAFAGTDLLAARSEERARELAAEDGQGS